MPRLYPELNRLTFNYEPPPDTDPGPAQRMDLERRLAAAFHGVKPSEVTPDQIPAAYRRAALRGAFEDTPVMPPTPPQPPRDPFTREPIGPTRSELWEEFVESPLFQNVIGGLQEEPGMYVPGVSERLAAKMTPLGAEPTTLEDSIMRPAPSAEPPTAQDPLALLGDFAEGFGRAPSPIPGFSWGDLGGKVGDALAWWQQAAESGAGMGRIVGIGLPEPDLETPIPKLGYGAGALPTKGPKEIGREAQYEISKRVQQRNPQTPQAFLVAVWEAAGDFERERPEVYPGAKAVGQALLDPLNLIGLGWEPRIARFLTSGARQTMRVARNAAEEVQSVIPAAARRSSDAGSALSTPPIEPPRTQRPSSQYSANAVSPSPTTRRNTPPSIFGPAINLNLGSIDPTSTRNILPQPPAAEGVGGAFAEIADDVNVLGLRPITRGLLAREKIEAGFRQALRGPSQEERMTPAFRERKRLNTTIDTQATTVSEQLRSDLRLFTFDKQGRIPALATAEFPNGPGFRDVTDAPNTFPLGAEQHEAIEGLRQMLAPYDELAQQVGVREHGIRRGISEPEGGFYVPRGAATPSGYDEPVRVTSARRGGASYAKPARLGSEAEGIELGYHYASPVEAVQTYIQQVGRNIADRYTANYLLALEDGGRRVAQTAADRIDPNLRAAITALRQKIATRRISQAKTTAAENELQFWLRGWSQAADAGDYDKVLQQAQDGIDALRRNKGVRAQELTQLQDELQTLRPQWRQAQRVAQQVPRSRGRVDMPELGSYDFPQEMANAANMVLARERRRGTLFTDAAKALNALHVTVTATLDDSAVMIQGLLGAVSRPRAWAQAMKLHYQVFADPSVYGAFLKEFDARAVEAGLPTVRRWAQHGLHQAPLEGGVAREMGASGIGAIGKLHGFKQTGRLYTYFGNRLRLTWAQAALADELKHGRTLDDLVESGDLDRIAETVNRSTGWSPEIAGGDFGSLALYAGRFFQARVETLINGLAGMRPGAPLDQRLARNSLLKLLGGAMALTHAINAAQGRETDMNLLLSDGRGGKRFNPNFMRARIGDFDVPILGTYYSLLGAIVSTATGNPDRALRSLGSQSLRTVWDMLAGENAIGERVRDTPEEFTDWLVDSFMPFTMAGIKETAPAVARRFSEGDIPKGVSNLIAGGAQALGGSASPLSPTDVLRDADGVQTDEYYGVPGVMAAMLAEGDETVQRQLERYYELANKQDYTRMDHLERQELKAALGDLTTEMTRGVSRIRTELRRDNPALEAYLTEKERRPLQPVRPRTEPTPTRTPTPTPTPTATPPPQYYQTSTAESNIRNMLTGEAVQKWYGEGKERPETYNQLTAREAQVIRDLINEADAHIFRKSNGEVKDLSALAERYPEDANAMFRQMVALLGARPVGPAPTPTRVPATATPDRYREYQRYQGSLR